MANPPSSPATTSEKRATIIGLIVGSLSALVALILIADLPFWSFVLVGVGAFFIAKEVAKRT